MAGKDSDAPAACTQRGPRRKVHIQIKYMNKGKAEGPPSPELRAKCERVEETLVEKDAGTIGRDSMSGGGSVDIYVLTEKPEKAMAEAWKIINHLGLGQRTTIKIAGAKAED
jgi:hypothetical protein